jgi:hypothetical protein
MRSTNTKFEGELMAIVVMSISSSVCVLVLCAVLVWTLITAKQERKELYDRIQAGTLRDYVYSEQIRDPAPEKTETAGSSLVDDMDYTQPEDQKLDDELLADLQTLQAGFTTAMMIGRD